MKYKVLGFLVAGFITLASVSFAQVASVEVQGVEATAAKSQGLTALLRDGSVGEVTVLIKVSDASGNPVEGAEVSWRVESSTDATVYAIATSASMARILERALGNSDVSFAGGTTDANGEAYLIVDSQSAGDAMVYVSVDGVEGKTYDNRDMRVVWF
jgi:ABC-type uncharacterized transport system substrate-binding protein